MSDMNNLIKIAGNSVQELRRSDVFRILEQNAEEQRSALAAFITKERPDLADEVTDCLVELEGAGQ